MLKRVRAMAGTTVVVLVVALSLVGAGTRLLTSPKTELVAGSDFTIASAVKPSPICSGVDVTLSPGVVRCLVYTVTNPLPDPITVTDLGITMDPAYAEPVGCPATNLD